LRHFFEDLEKDPSTIIRLGAGMGAWCCPVAFIKREGHQAWSVVLHLSTELTVAFQKSRESMHRQLIT
jgi:hypothetical protein